MAGPVGLIPEEGPQNDSTANTEMLPAPEAPAAADVSVIPKALGDPVPSEMVESPDEPTPTPEGDPAGEPGTPELPPAGPLDALPEAPATQGSARPKAHHLTRHLQGGGRSLRSRLMRGSPVSHAVAIGDVAVGWDALARATTFRLGP